MMRSKYMAFESSMSLPRDSHDVADKVLSRDSLVASIP